MNCSKCGDPVAADAGFCRGCGAILLGRSASASIVEGTTPRPPSSVTAAHGTAPAMLPRTSRSQRGGDGYRMRGVMLTLDCAIIAAGLVVLLSTTISWYETSVVVHGVRETLSRHLLSGRLGIQRPLVPIVAGVTVIEVLLNMARVRARQEAWRSQRGVVMLLCVLQFVLVVSCILSSPLSSNSLANIGISLDTGPGGWLALGGASLGLLVAFARLFAGRSALGRSTPLPSRTRGQPSSR